MAPVIIKAIEGWAVERPKVRVNGMFRYDARWLPLSDYDISFEGVVQKTLDERRAVDYRLPAADNWRCSLAGALPDIAQWALHNYHNVHGCRDIHAGTLMWYGDMKVVDLMYGVMNDIARTQGYLHFAHYHEWYLENVLSRDEGRGVPKDSTEVWPVILSTFADEGLQDGSHRFHQYVERGLTTIPVLAYTTELQEIERVISDWKRGNA